MSKNKSISIFTLFISLSAVISTYELNINTENSFLFNRRDLQVDFIIKCSKEGSCQRSDNIQLKLGWVPRIPQKNFQNIFDTKEKTIVSLNPFTNSTSLQFIKGSKNFTCADGVNECFNSCCNKGLCTDPSNVCTEALKSSKARIYATCIAYVLMAIAYWVVFGYLGVKYSKKKATVQIEGKVGIQNNTGKENLINENNESVRSRGISALDNFDDKYNTENFNVNNTNSNFIKGNLIPSNYDNQFLESQGGLYNNKPSNNYYDQKEKDKKIFESTDIGYAINQNKLNKLNDFNNVEMGTTGNNFNNNNNNMYNKKDFGAKKSNLDDHVLDQEVQGKNSQPQPNMLDESNSKIGESEFEVKDLDF